MDASSIKSSIPTRTFSGGEGGRVEAFLLFRPLAKISLRNRLEKMASALPEEHLKELKGVALGSGLSWDDLLWMTFSPDFFSPGGKLFAFQHKEWVVGRTLESSSPLLRFLSEKSLILYVEPSEGYRHLAFGFQNSLLFPTAVTNTVWIIAFNGEGSERKDNLSGGPRQVGCSEGFHSRRSRETPPLPSPPLPLDGYPLLSRREEVHQVGDSSW